MASLTTQVVLHRTGGAGEQNVSEKYTLLFWKKSLAGWRFVFQQDDKALPHLAGQTAMLGLEASL